MLNLNRHRTIYMKKSLFLFFFASSTFISIGQRIVDYRYCQSPLRNQGERGTCTAFAIAAVLETFNGVPANLSEQYLYACLQMGDYLDTNKIISPGGSLFGYSKSLQQYGVLHESRMPYNKKQLETPDSAKRLVQVILEAQEGPVSVLTKTNFAKTFVQPSDCKTFTFIEASDTSLIKGLLRKGHKAIAVAYYVNAAWSNWMHDKNLVITPDSVGFFMSDTAKKIYSFQSLKNKYGKNVWDSVNSYYSFFKFKPYSFETFYNPEGHAITIVGYNDKGFIIKNSWGPDWGNNGYAVMSYDYHMLFVAQALVVNKVSFAQPAPATTLSPLFTDIRLKVIPGKTSEGISFSLFNLDEKYDPVFSSIEYRLFEVNGTQKKLLERKTIVAPVIGYNQAFTAQMLKSRFLPLSIVSGKSKLQMEITARHAISQTSLKRIYKNISIKNDEYKAVE